jgi:hypothetical protein
MSQLQHACPHRRHCQKAYTRPGSLASHIMRDHRTDDCCMDAADNAVGWDGEAIDLDHTSQPVHDGDPNANVLVPPYMPAAEELEEVEDAPVDNNRASPQPDSTSTVEKHPYAGWPCGIDPDYALVLARMINDPWHPFKSQYDFQQAARFVDAGVSRTAIDRHFNEGACLNQAEFSYDTGYLMYQRIAEMEENLPQWTQSKATIKGVTRDFFHRNPVDCARYLLGQRAYRNNMVYGPVRVTDSAGDRVFSEMNTGNWWWETQDRLPHGATIVPLIVSSDETMLTDHSGDQKAWPMYLSIGNIEFTVRGRPNMLAQILVALLPVPPKLSAGSSAKRQDESQLNQDFLAAVIPTILQPLHAFQKTTDLTDGALWPCADGNMRRCWPILSSWLADHMEYANLMGVKYNACPKCFLPINQFGSLIDPDELKKYQRTAALFQPKYESYCNPSDVDNCHHQLDNDGDRESRRELEDWFAAHCARPAPCVLWGLPHSDAYDLHRPDILHNIYLGMYQHVMSWIDGFLEEHDRMENFEAIWRAIPAYPEFRHPKRGYSQVSQWSGKEMRNFGRILYPAFAAALHGPRAGQRKAFSQALACIRGLAYWSLVVQYPTQTAETINYLHDYLQEFHENKKVFLPFRKSKTAVTAGKKAKASLKTDIQAGLKAAGRPPKLSKAQRKQLDEAYRMAFEENSGFNFVKMHLLLHYPESIERFGNLLHVSTESSESNHSIMVTEPYRRSNSKPGYQNQILSDYGRIYALKMRRLQLRQLAIEGWTTPETQETLGLYTPKDYNLVKLRLRKGQPVPPDLEVHIESQEEVTLTRGVSSTIRHGFWAREELMDGFNMDLSDYLLPYFRTELGMPELDKSTVEGFAVTRYKVLKVPVANFQTVGSEEYTTHRLLCTGAEKFHGTVRNDFIWMRISDNCDFGDVGDLRPAQLIRILQLQDPQHPDQLRKVVVVRELKVENNGNCMLGTGLLKVSDIQYRPQQSDLLVASVQTVHSAAHLLRIPSTRSYYVNNTIDLATFNWAWPKTAAAAAAAADGESAEEEDIGGDEVMLDLEDDSTGSSITSSDTEDDDDVEDEDYY